MFKAQAILFENKNLDHEYSPVEGSEIFIQSSLKVAYGENYIPLKENRIGAIQSLSGTGALRLGLEFCKKFLDNSKKNSKKIPKMFPRKCNLHPEAWLAKP